MVRFNDFILPVKGRGIHISSVVGALPVLRSFSEGGCRDRNRRIGEFLKEFDLAEGRNTGIGKIVRAMRENGSPDPQFYNPETRSFMTVILPIHEAFKVEVALP